MNARRVGANTLLKMRSVMRWLDILVALTSCKSESDMATRTFTATIEKDRDTGYSAAQCVELPAAISQGKTEAEANKSVKEAIELVLEHLKEKADVKGPGKKLVGVAI